MKVRLKKIPITEIRVGKDHRQLNPEKVKAIAELIEAIGLKTPPTIRNTKKGFELVTGHHRVAAMKLLQAKEIECHVIKEGKINARLWTCAENLHRAELTPIEHADVQRRWERQLQKRDKAAQRAQPGGRQPNDKGISRTAKSLGVSRDTVRRRRQIGKLTPKAKKAASKAGLSQAAILKVATKKGTQAQLTKIAKLARSDGERNGQLSWGERRQFKRLTKFFDAAREFKREWEEASTVTRRAFVKKVLRPGA